MHPSPYFSAPSPTARISYTAIHRPILCRTRFEYLVFSHRARALWEYSVDGRSFTVSVRRVRTNINCGSAQWILLIEEKMVWELAIGVGFSFGQI